jgi:uncharacterized protein (TIGR02145 family)
MMSSQKNDRNRYLRQRNKQSNLMSPVRSWRNLSVFEKQAWTDFVAAFPQTCKNPDSGFLTGYQSFIKRNQYLKLNYGIDEPLMIAPEAIEIFDDPVTFTLVRESDKLILYYVFTNNLNDIDVSVYLSYRQSPGREYQNTQTRYMGVISNVVETVIKYGSLYNWMAASDVRNLANTGWRVSIQSDWNTLISYLGLPTSGGKIKETGTTYWNAPNTGATNETMFNCRGAGNRNSYTDFAALKMYTHFWTSDKYGSYVVAKSVQYNASDIKTTYGQTGSEKIGYSIRLVKESTTLSNGQSGEYTGNDGKIYRTICIGTQEWLADNLNETLFRNLDPVPLVPVKVDWFALTSAGRCYYNNLQSNGYSEPVPNLDVTDLYITNFGLVPEVSDYLLFRAIPCAKSNGQFFTQTKQVLTVE